MIVAVVWPREISKTSPTEKAARQIGRFIAAAGHALMLSPADALSQFSSEDYRTAGGARLIGLLGQTRPSAVGTSFFDETVCGVRRDEFPDRMFQLADAVLFMEALPKEPDWINHIGKNEKPAYLITNAAHPELPENARANIRILTSVDEFARELARLFSRQIISRPDPMKEKLRKMGTP